MTHRYPTLPYATPARLPKRESRRLGFWIVFGVVALFAAVYAADRLRPRVALPPSTVTETTTQSTIDARRRIAEAGRGY